MKKITILFLCFVMCVFCFVGCNSAKSNSKKLSSYEINATLNYDEKTINATQNVSYVNTANQELSFVCFNLHPSAFRENAKSSVVGILNKSKCYPNGQSFGNIEILNCKIQGKVATFEICGDDENILKIILFEPLKQKKKVNFQIEFVLTIPNCNHRFGYNEQTINLGNWYPIACVFENGFFRQDCYHSNGDPFYSECANYVVNLTAPANLTVAGSGNKTTKTNNETTTSTFKAQSIRDFALVVGDFKTLEAKTNGVKILYYYYDDISCQKSLETAKKSISTFNELFGKYPYEVLSVVQTKFVQGGMEYSSLVMISDSLPTHEDYEMVIVHETAHQWWFGVVGSNQIDNAWQDEGLAEFSTALFYKENEEYEVDFEDYFKKINNSYTIFETVYKKILNNLNTSLTRKISDYNTEPEYTYLTYVKGNLMFKNLFDDMGEKKFLKALKNYYKTYKFKIATPQNLIDCFNKYSKNNIQPFFDNWLCGNVELIEVA